MKAEFDVIKHVPGEFIYIRDIGRNCRSVTNDAENVIERLLTEYGITRERVIYDDSDGRTDELLHANGKFTGFKAGHEGIELEQANSDV